MSDCNENYKPCDPRREIKFTFSLEIVLLCDFTAPLKLCPVQAIQALLAIDGREKKIEWNNSNCLACNLNFNLGELLWTNWKARKEKYFHRYAWTLERHQWRIEGPGCFRVIYLSQHPIARFTEHHCIEHGMNKSIWARFWRKKAL